MKDFWHCLNESSIHKNTNNTFPNLILPVLDHSFSSLGVVINVFLLLTIYVWYRRCGTISSSSIFCVSICLANLIECINSLILFGCGRVSSKANQCVYVAAGILDVVQSVRINSTFPIFLIRLLYVLSPQTLVKFRTRFGRWEKTFCQFFWVSAAVIGGFRTFLRIKMSMKDVNGTGSNNWWKYMNRISFCLILVNGLISFIGIALSFLTICYLVTVLCKCHWSKSKSDAQERSTSHSVSLDHKNLIADSVRSCLKPLTVLFIADSIFQIYQALLSLTALKIYLSPGCYPEIFVQIRNYLGTSINYVYSYHCLDVIHGISVCIIFFLQKPFKQAIRFMWKVSRLIVMQWRS